MYCFMDTPFSGQIFVSLRISGPTALYTKRQYLVPLRVVWGFETKETNHFTTAMLSYGLPSFVHVFNQQVWSMVLDTISN